MMLLQVLQTHKLQILITSYNWHACSLTPQSTASQSLYASRATVQVPEKKVSGLEIDKSICKIIAMLFSYELHACLRVLKN